MCGDRLAMGPLAQRDIDRVVEVLLRGLERRAAHREPQADMTAPTAGESSSAVESVSSLEFGDTNVATGTATEAFTDPAE